MAFSEIDRTLLQRCLNRQSKSWDDFVGRFLGLVIHVVNHTAKCKSIRLGTQDREDLVGEVFLAIVDDDFALLRRFRGESSLATYLTVIARRIVTRELLKRKGPTNLGGAVEEQAGHNGATVERISNRDEVERLLAGLNGTEADAVRLYHLEGKSYREISVQIGVPENSIGPTLTRARAKLRAEA